MPSDKEQELPPVPPTIASVMASHEERKNQLARRGTAATVAALRLAGREPYKGGGQELIGLAREIEEYLQNG